MKTRKKRKDEPEAVTFWKNNLISGEHSMTEAQLVEAFKAWLPNQKPAWLEYYYGEPAIRNFLALADDGIRSTFDETDFAHLYNWLLPVIESHMMVIEEAEKQAIKDATK
jgi:hypothetical protein